MLAEKKKGLLVLVGIVIVLILLSLSIVFLLLDNDSSSSSAPDNVISGGDTQFIAMENGTAKGEPFNLTDMLPGDRESAEYTLKVKSGGVLAVSLGAEILTEEGALSDVLMADVRRTGANEALYDGLLKELPQGLRVPVSEGEDTVSLTVTVYLDTSVGNEYKNCGIKARLSFWVAEEDVILSGTIDEEPPRRVWPIVVGAVSGTGAVGGLVWLVVFLVRRKKTVTDGVQGGDLNE